MNISIKAFKTFYIRFQYVILTILLVLITSTVLAFYNLKRFEQFTRDNLQYEGILLANAIGSGISSDISHSDIVKIQTIIDRFSSVTKFNIEINVMFLEETGSKIVASNNKGNIEETSKVEHHNLLAALKQRKPIVFLDHESIEKEQDKDDQFHEARYLSITVPMYSNNKGIGSINAKLSLTSIDEKIATIRLSIQIATLGIVAIPRQIVCTFPP